MALCKRDAPGLLQVPAATYKWYSNHDPDRNDPLRFILRCNGVAFPDTPEEEK